MTAYTNPVLPGFYPDPSVCRVGDTYYLANSTFEYFPAIPLHASTDLVTWTPIGHAIDRAGQVDLTGVPDSGGIFAPTLRHHDGVFYLVCTNMGSSISPGGGSFLITAADPAGPWSDPVWIENAAGIDPSLHFHDGKIWWVGCRPVDPGAYFGEFEVWLRELDVDAGELVGHEYLLWNGASRIATWTEGPHLYERNGWFYLIASEGGTERKHAAAVARSRDLTGPYEGYLGNPILTHRHLGETFTVQNVGHTDMVEAVDGSWWLFALGVRTVDGQHLLGRETFLTPVSWEADWPVINAGVGRLSASGSTPFSTTSAPTAAEFHQEFRQEVIGDTDRAPVGGQWLSLRGSPDWATTGGGGMRLTPTDDDLSSPTGSPAFLGYRLQHLQVDLSIRVAPPVVGVIVGLALRQSAGFQLRLELVAVGDGYEVTAVRRDGAVDTVAGSTRFASPPATPSLDDFELTASLHGLEVTLGVSRGADIRTVAVADALVLSTEHAGGFVGTVAGPFAVRSPGVDGSDASPATILSFSYAGR